MRSGKSKDTEISESTSASTSDDDTATIPAQVLDSDVRLHLVPFATGNFLSDTGPIVRMMGTIVFSAAFVSSVSQKECHLT